MIELNHTWTSTGSTAAFTPVAIPDGVIEAALYLQCSTLATTNTVEFQTAQESTGPWAIEASTTISTLAAQQIVLRLTGPFLYMRPNLKTVSTGAYTLRLLGVS